MSENQLTIGWIGVGVMGKSMCKHLLKKGYKLLVNTRTPAKAQEVIEAGGVFHTQTEIATHADIIFLMLGYPKDVEEVVLGIDGILKHMKKGASLVDHTTSSPDLAAKIALACKEKGIHCLDAPVSGGDIGAQNGQLVTMCGGEKEAFDQL